LNRRTLLRGAAAVPLLIAVRPLEAAEPTGTPFSATTVRDAAQELSTKPFQAQVTELPAYLSKLTYDQYRMLRFDKAHALWHGMKIPYQVEFNHRGFIYSGRVDVNEVVDGRAMPVPYTPAMFDFGSVQRPTNEDLGFAGFRLHAPLNKPDYFDEVCSFLGASYFRAVAKGLTYGLSARGLAIKTADQTGEEFPYFKTFWIERPKPGTKLEPITVHALLDSPSCAASFRFVITPGVDTVFDTQVTVFPRVDMTQIGIAPLTSMFFFDSNDRARTNDWRPAVHDSDGLLMLTGRGETLWRALANPRALQVSSFMDKSPKGFGLMQRKRKLDDYQDLESNYETRPACWVEPVGDWGAGNVVLVEIPTDSETNDNIVAFWRPKQNLQAKVSYNFAYRLHWSAGAPVKTPAPFTATMVGAGSNNIRNFVLNISGLKPDIKPRLDVTSDKGKLLNLLMQPDPKQGGWRISFDLDPGREPLVELHGRLMQGDVPLTETWMYRWTT
jgi:glucans biosynthesis protein